MVSPRKISSSTCLLENRHRRRDGLRHRIFPVPQSARLSMEERMTVCNMSIEGGAASGPDHARRQNLRVHFRSSFAPKGADFYAAVGRWKFLLRTKAQPTIAKSTIDANTLEPMITFGTNPGWASHLSDWSPTRRHQRSSGAQNTQKALASTWTCPPANRCSATPSTWCSSEAAPIRASPSAPPPAAVFKGRKINPKCSRDGGPWFDAGEGAGASRRARPDFL